MEPRSPCHLENHFQLERRAERKAGDAIHLAARVVVFRRHFPLGMNPGTPVSTTGLSLIRNLIPSFISRMASSGRVETSKFSLIRLGVFEVVRSAVPRWIANASTT